MAISLHYLRIRPMKLIDWIWFKYFQFQSPTNATEKVGIVKLMFERIKININKIQIIFATIMS